VIEDISAYVDANRDTIVCCLKALVDQKGGSENAEAVNRVDGCHSQLIITSERPLWDGLRNTDEQKSLADIIRNAAEQIRVPFGTEIRKGTSDANFFGARGVSVVDGMGPIGFHDHSRREYILLDSLFDRIKLCALVLCRLQS